MFSFIFSTHTVFIFNCPACVPDCMYTQGISGVCSHSGPSDILPEASSQPISHTVPQCTIAPQRVRPGLLRAGPQHPATLRYACKRLDPICLTPIKITFLKTFFNMSYCVRVSERQGQWQFWGKSCSKTYYSGATLLHGTLSGSNMFEKITLANLLLNYL